MRLKDRTAIITGAGSGIGQATAKLFAQEGAIVAVSDLTEEHTRETVEAIKAAGGKAIGIGCDVTDQDQVEAMVARTIADLGRVDILVNNAGIAPSADFKDMTRQQWDTMLAVHLDGLFHCSRAVVNHMIDNGWGRILITASTSGMKGDATLVHYSAAKAGQIGFAKALSLEVAGKGVTVNLVCPGLTRTPIQANVDLGVIERALGPVGRWGEPEDQGWAFVYLASEEAGYVTGQIISPNGGVL